MDAFVAREADVLVATSVIEVGIDVPNATVMIVEAAERFGLSQLHQLRGRIGRGAHPSVCILFGQADLPRLAAIADEPDGFRLAEVDLALRGAGDVLGTRQHGLPDLRTARLPEDADLLETGIGGIGIVLSLMEGYDALVIVDAVERGAQPGTVFVLVPQVPDIATPTFDEWLAQLSDMHLAEPSRILRIARAAGVLPEHVLVVGCQPETCEDFAEALSAPVAAAVLSPQGACENCLQNSSRKVALRERGALHGTPPARRNSRRGRK